MGCSLHCILNSTKTFSFSKQTSTICRFASIKSNGTSFNFAVRVNSITSFLFNRRPINNLIVVFIQTHKTNAFNNSASFQSSYLLISIPMNLLYRPNNLFLIAPDASKQWCNDSSLRLRSFLKYVNCGSALYS